MSAHTPGPWHIGGVFMPGTGDETVDIWSATPPGLQSGDQIAQYVRPSDARLITAAPEMLEALRAFMTIEPDFASASERHLREIIAEKRSSAPLAAAVLLARAAIAKAEGRE